MSRKVFTSMLTLCVAALVGCYFLKLFFPQEFVMAISNQRVVEVGNFIDGRKWLYYICCGFTAFITYYLYCGASSGRYWLGVKGVLSIIGVIAVVRIVSWFDEPLSSALQLSSFLFLPWVTSGKLKNSAIVYSVHCISQGLSLSIRNLPIYLKNTNFTIGLFMTGECYLWLILFFIVYNYKDKKGE